METDVPAITLDGYALSHEEVERMTKAAVEELKEIRKQLGYETTGGSNMPDREKVVEGLRHCTAWAGLHECQPKIGPDCPYEDEADCKLALMRDALAMLKEQEIGHWISLENCSNSGVYCSECHTKIFDRYPFKKKFSYFCPHCGTRMEGEIERQ